MPTLGAVRRKCLVVDLEQALDMGFPGEAAKEMGSTLETTAHPAAIASATTMPNVSAYDGKKKIVASLSAA
jgi:hypothetical protein